MSYSVPEHWGSRWGFMLATAGSAVGLGNIWKFPYITGINGGGAFVLIYLGCVMLVGFPIMVAELTLGRAAGVNSLAAFRTLTPARTMLSDLIAGGFFLAGAGLAMFSMFGYALMFFLAGAVMLRFGWSAFGIGCGVVAPLVISSYYAVIGGWTIIYVVKSFAGSIRFTTPEGAAAVMNPIVRASSGYLPWVIGAQALFIFLCGLVLASGVRKGIERWSKVLMPVLFGLLTVLILRGISLPSAAAGLKFFLQPDFSKLSANGVIVAMGHAFFTLSLAMGITLTYGSYLDRNVNIVKSALIVIGLDTLAAMMAGMAIFPAVFAMGFREDAGPDLIYKILPAAFNSIPGGAGGFWNGMFFLMIFIAALTSGISLIEPLISICVGEWKMRRRTAVWTTVFLLMLTGSFVSVSMAGWERMPELGRAAGWLWGAQAPAHLFDMLDSFSCNWLLPLVGLGITIYVGWVWGVSYAVEKMRHGAGGRLDANVFQLLAGLRSNSENTPAVCSPALCWGLLVRWITPLLVLAAFLNGIGVIRF